MSPHRWQLQAATALRMERTTPGRMVRCPSGTVVWCRPVAQCQTLWLPLPERLRVHPAWLSSLRMTRVCSSAITVLVYSVDSKQSKH